MGVIRFFRRRWWDEERAREIESYLAIEIDDNLARGLPPDEARRAAYRALGNPTRIREELYRMNTVTWLETAGLDVRDAWRQLRRRPLNLVLSLILLTLGIGAATAAFSVAWGVLARPLPFPDADRLATLWDVQDDRGIPQQVSYPDLEDIRAVAPFTDTVALGSGRATLTAGGEVARVNLVEAEPALLPMLGGRTLAGRLPAASDAGQPVAVISHRLWTGMLQRDPDAVGRALSLSGRTFTIIGVLAGPVDFELPVGAASLGQGFRIEDVDVWMPLDPSDELASSRAITTYEALVKLPAGGSVASAARVLDTIAQRLAAAHPDTNRGRTFRIIPLRRQMVAGSVTPIGMALAGGILILLIACVNLASLFLGDLPARRLDFALREALGAGRARLLRQAAIESLMLSAAGGAAGILLARALVAAFEAAIELPRVSAIRFDLSVVLFAVIAAFAAGCAARLLPVARIGGAAAGLRPSTSRYATSAPTVRRLLVAVQLAFALVLAVAAVLLGMSLRHLHAIDAGFGAKDALTFRTSAYPASYPDKADVMRFFDAVIDQIHALPGMDRVAAGSSLPLSGSGTGTSVAVEGGPVRMADRPTAGWQMVTPGYFEAAGIALRRGRDFTAADRDRQPHRVVISETLARRLFPSEDPIGRRIALGPDDPVTDWHEVIGVVADVRHASLTEAPAPRAYDLFGQHWSRTMYVVARGDRDPNAAAPAVRETVRRIDPTAPVFDVRSLADLRARATAPRTASTVLAAGIAAVGLWLACTGVFGLVAASVAARTREIGIRRALGSSNAGVLRLIVRETAGLAAGGLAGGLVLSLAASRIVQSQLVGVTASSPTVFAGVLATLAGAAAVATLIPARRAIRVDPATALRIEE